MAVEKKEIDAGLRCAWGVLLLVLCLFISLSLFSYDWKDISRLQVPPLVPTGNLIGPVGAGMSFLLFTSFGVGAYLVPLVCLIFGIILVINRDEKAWPRIIWSGVLMLAIVSVFELNSAAWVSTCRKLNILPDTGGIFGRLLMRGLLIKWFSPVGAGILVWAALVVSFVMLVEMENIMKSARHGFALACALWDRWQAKRAGGLDRRDLIEREAQDVKKQIAREERRAKSRPPAAEEVPPVAEQAAPPPPPPEAVEKPAPPPKRKLFAAAEKPVEKPAPPEPPPAVAPSLYPLPPMSLLAQAASDENREIQSDSATTAKILVDTLAEFGIQTQCTNVEKGPVVTRYELLPAPGIRLEKIAALSNNLALSLKATSIRVQAPIPGKGVVGIEVPNSFATMVCLREVLESDAWRSPKVKLPLALGKDVGGNVLVADLADMPHLLIAGATGSGKTVCMNSILMGLLMARGPDQLRLMLVDPKIVEFSAYNALPHLIVPVITNPKRVALSLRWAINEMEKRYKTFAKARVRNIESFNHREIAEQRELFSEPGAEASPESEQLPARLPYIVIVVDELADLMLADQSEIENCIARLAQLSRAVGIHMILATQRPSVNVITGTIKANFPARMAFQVAQKVDSRTILDTSGADKLLGRGDMLFLPPGTSKLVRAQGAMVSDPEIHGVTEYIRGQAAPAYLPEIQEKMERPESKLDEGVDDTLIEQSLQIIRETQRASTSSLQRRLRIGYTRAARIIDILEERGILGPPRGAEPREILIDLDGEIPNNQPQPTE